jgi:hypothetical protein
MKSPVEIGWDAWFRSIDLVTSRKLKGRELLMRTRGWWTVEPEDVLNVVEPLGKLVLGDRGELMVEFENESQVAQLADALSKRFEEQVMLSP